MEKTACYKCGEDITAPEGAVHPLCSDCDTDFQAWFDRALNGEV